MGPYGVGKTSLVRRFVESLFDERYHTTMGVKIDKKLVTVNDTGIMLLIWDLAGEDEIENMRLSHLRGASGYALVIDGCRESTLASALALRERAVSVFGDLPYVVAINKADLRDDWEIDISDVPNGDPTTVFITSAKTGAGVESMFDSLATKMLSQR